MEPSKYCASKNEEKLYLYRTEGFFNTKILPSATAQYHSTYWRTVIPGSTLDSIIFPIPAILTATQTYRNQRSPVIFYQTLPLGTYSALAEHTITVHGGTTDE